MTFERGQIIGLSSLQVWVYEFCRKHSERKGRAPTFPELRQASTDWRRGYLARAIERLVQKRYLRIGLAGELMPLKPPHDRIIMATCEELGFSLDEIRAPGRTPLLVTRARRILAKRIRSELKYPVAAIGRIVNRHWQTVEEYFDPEERQRRNSKRAEKLRAAREMRA